MDQIPDVQPFFVLKSDAGGQQFALMPDHVTRRFIVSAHSLNRLRFLVRSLSGRFFPSTKEFQQLPDLLAHLS